MGQEAHCTARIAGKAVSGRLQLEANKLTFRAKEVRVRLPVGEIAEARADGGTLAVRTREVSYEFDLGAAAERWAQHLLNPKSLVEKLGINAGADLAYIGPTDGGLSGELERAGAKIARRRGRDHDWVFVGVEQPADLERLAGLDAAIKPNGGIWVVFPKGRTDLKDTHVIAAGRSAGFADTKVARISERLTGLKFVIPVKRRK